jgi:hypothetical protein
MNRQDMTKMSGILLAAIFAALSLFHIYWAIGGSFGKAVAIPTVRGNRCLDPSPLATIMVAVALLIAMLIVIGQLGMLGEVIPKWIFRWGNWGICIIFLLRAVGEFRLVGFFKQVRDTEFAYWDTRLFSPLCLVIVMLALIVANKEA